MQFPDHYLGTIWVCRKAGIPEPLIAEIAWASQAVDDYLPGLVPPVVCLTRAALPCRYVSLAPTQDYAYWEAPEHKTASVWVPFHFPPSDSGDLVVQELPAWGLQLLTERLGHLRWLVERCGPDPANAEIRFVCHTIGIIDHMLKASGSHQSFVGARCSVNSVGYAWCDPRALVPNVGHAEVRHSPDEAGAIWWRTRRTVRVVSRTRWLRVYAGLLKVYIESGFPGAAAEVTVKTFDTDNLRSWFMHELSAYPEYANPKKVEPTQQLEVWRSGRESTFFRAAAVHRAYVTQLTQA